jgi:hypothetical protein
LESAETPLDFAFGLRRWGNQMGDTKGVECTLKLAFRVTAVAA